MRGRAGGCLTDVVRASFVEIYMEKATDLIVEPDARQRARHPAWLRAQHASWTIAQLEGTQDLQFREDERKTVFIKGACQVVVQSAEQVAQVLELGLTRRKTGFTGSNEVSSRSHAVFILTVDSTDSEALVTKTSQLYCCDLAGSEKITKTIVAGMSPAEKAKVMKEGQRINTSLLALGNVIAALSKGAKHIPYRDSKLTRLLKNSFGGNARTAVVVCCSPSPLNAAETLSTLKFGDRSQKIKNVAVQNVFRSAKELAALLRKAEEQLEQSVALAEGLAHENGELREGLRGALHRLALGEGGSGGRMPPAAALAAAYAQPARHTVGAAREILGGHHAGRSMVDGLSVVGMICPLSKCVLSDAVVACDGWTYERKPLEMYWRMHGLLSPVDGSRLHSRALVSNKALRQVVGSFFTEHLREGPANYFDWLSHEAVVHIFRMMVLGPDGRLHGTPAAVARDLCRAACVCGYFVELASTPELWEAILGTVAGGWAVPEGGTAQAEVRRLLGRSDTQSPAAPAESGTDQSSPVAHSTHGLRLAPSQPTGSRQTVRVSWPRVAEGVPPR